MIPQEITRFIGKTGETMILEVEKGAVRKFADAVGDPNPLYWDEEYARRSRFGTIVAPQGFFGWPVKWKWGAPLRSELRREMSDAIGRAGYSRNLDGGIEYDFYRPVRVGDILSSAFKIKDIYEKETKTGVIVFSVTETTYTNQNGDIVARARQTAIHR